MDASLPSVPRSMSLIFGLPPVKMLTMLKTLVICALDLAMNSLHLVLFMRLFAILYPLLALPLACLHHLPYRLDVVQRLLFPLDRPVWMAPTKQQLLPSLPTSIIRLFHQRLPRLVLLSWLLEEMWRSLRLFSPMCFLSVLNALWSPQVTVFQCSMSQWA